MCFTVTQSCPKSRLFLAAGGPKIMEWGFPEQKRTSTSANATIPNLFRKLLYCEKIKANGRPQSFAPARFSLTITLKFVFVC